MPHAEVSKERPTFSTPAESLQWIQDKFNDHAATYAALYDDSDPSRRRASRKCLIEDIEWYLEGGNPYFPVYGLQPWDIQPWLKDIIEDAFRQHYPEKEKQSFCEEKAQQEASLLWQSILKHAYKKLRAARSDEPAAAVGAPPIQASTTAAVRGRMEGQ